MNEATEATTTAAARRALIEAGNALGDIRSGLSTLFLISTSAQLDPDAQAALRHLHAGMRDAASDVDGHLDDATAAFGGDGA